MITSAYLKLTVLEETPNGHNFILRPRRSGNISRVLQPNMIWTNTSNSILKSSPPNGMKKMAFGDYLTVADGTHFEDISEILVNGSGVLKSSITELHPTNEMF